MKVFKLLVTPVIITSIFILTSCSPKEEPAVEEFEEFIVQVEHSIKDKEIKNWSEVEQEFYQRWDIVENSADDLSDEANQELDKLRIRYDALKSEWQDDSEEAKRNLRESMNELNAFLKRSEDQASEVSEDVITQMEQEFAQLKNSVQNSADNAGEDIDSAMEGIEDRFNNVRSAWKNRIDS